MPTPLPPGTPSIQLSEIDTYRFPCVTLPAALDGWTFNADGKTRDACQVPAGSLLVDFHRDVAATWLGKHGPAFPQHVRFPDGRFLYMLIHAGQALEIVRYQHPVDWDTARQMYRPRAVEVLTVQESNVQHAPAFLYAQPIRVTWLQCSPTCPGWGHGPTRAEPAEPCEICNRFSPEDISGARAAHDAECGVPFCAGQVAR